MLCVNKYPKDYVETCRAGMKAQLAAYKTLAATAGQPALDSFEPLYFNHLVVALDASFVHRSRTLELKDGNPLNEVRMLAGSILQNRAVLTADKAIKYNPAKAVLKLPIGTPIKLTESDFALLLKAFFAEIEAKFT